MISSPIALTSLAACLVAGLFVIHFRRGRDKGFVEISPRYRSFFRQLGVTEAAHFLGLSGETPHIVSGHPDRNVARITFSMGREQWSAFLKREHRVRWRTRLSNALAGFGLLSRSLREARILQALQREVHLQPGMVGGRRRWSGASISARARGSRDGIARRSACREKSLAAAADRAQARRRTGATAHGRFPSSRSVRQSSFCR